MQRKGNRSTLGTIGVELGFAPSARTHTLMDMTLHYPRLPAVDRAADAGFCVNLLVRPPSARGIPAVRPGPGLRNPGGPLRPRNLDKTLIRSAHLDFCIFFLTFCLL